MVTLLRALLSVRNAIFAFVILLFVFPVTTLAEVQDGFAWIKLSDSLKLGYVMGFVDAATWAYGNVDGATKVLKSLSPSDRKTLEGGKAVWDYSGIKYGQLVDGLNDFYKDFRNKGVHWDRAISYTRDQIHGLPQDYLEREIEFERQRASSPEYNKR